ncbi:helix-turn-helix domain-containing protein [Ereboglobus luteus]|uniref:HTH araC/xylS-type domain-containing protein n=1 Tax=Ereboglobus luteus TaxID=1796921 RepID=A0A2U8E405_9BACT|nr:helix-turn-helix domain-containing protein [Ereboglobus luteus]AWI09530.1 hypothetical protein CKA38_09995 [Ereboglobus luteus]
MPSAANYTFIPEYDDGDKLTHVEGDDVSIWYGAPEPHFRGEHSHERHQVIIMPESQSKAELFWRETSKAARSQWLTGSMMCFIGKGIPHAMRWEAQAPLICLCVTENYPRHFSQNLKRHGVFIHPWGKFISEDALMRGLIERICDLIRSPICSIPNYFAGLGTSLAVQLLNNPKFCQPATTTEDGLAPYQLKKVLDYIQAHLSEPIMVETLAGEVRLSKGYFTRLFTASTGLTPHRYIVEERLKSAKELLHQGTMKTAAIAAETGFHDQSHLSRSMHRQITRGIAAHSTNIQTEGTNIQSKSEETGQHGGTL